MNFTTRQGRELTVDDEVFRGHVGFDIWDDYAFELTLDDVERLRDHLTRLLSGLAEENIGGPVRYYAKGTPCHRHEHCAEDCSGRYYM